MNAFFVLSSLLSLRSRHHCSLTCVQYKQLSRTSRNGVPRTQVLFPGTPFLTSLLTTVTILSAVLLFSSFCGTVRPCLSWEWSFYIQGFLCIIPPKNAKFLCMSVSTKDVEFPVCRSLFVWNMNSLEFFTPFPEVSCSHSTQQNLLELHLASAESNIEPFRCEVSEKPHVCHHNDTMFQIKKLHNHALLYKNNITSTKFQSVNNTLEFFDGVIDTQLC